MKGRCAECHKIVEHIVQVTDHPNTHDGNYCDECNPYEIDRLEAEVQLEKDHKNGLYGDSE